MQIKPAMNEFSEITASNLRAIRIEKGMNQGEIADILGLKNHNISKLEAGDRELSPSEKSLLDWYFFGTMPPCLIESAGLRGTLEFSRQEWDIVELLAKRGGQSPAEWIRSSVLNIVYGSGKMTGASASPTDSEQNNTKAG